jgi:hypothetical protein
VINCNDNVSVDAFRLYKELVDCCELVVVGVTIKLS